MKKLLKTLFVTAAITVSTATTAFAGSIDYSLTDTEMQNVQNMATSMDIGSYIRTMFPAARPEFEEDVIGLFRGFENGTHQYMDAVYFSPNSDDTYRFFTQYETYNLVDLSPVYSKYYTHQGIIGYGFEFENKNKYDVNTFKYNYIRRAEMTKKLAAALRGASDEETVNNAIAWINEKWRENVGHGGEGSALATGILDGAYVDCSGCSTLFAQICLMNGIEARLVLGMKGDEQHQWNTVKLNGVEYHVDTLWNVYPTAGVPAGYVIESLNPYK